MSDNPKSTSKNAPNFAGEIRAKAARKMKARRHAAQGIGFGLGMMGIIGWSVVVPTLLGIALGLWLDTHHAGVHSWTLMLLVTGLMIGCLTAWHWVAAEDSAMRQEQENDDK
jgi:ATP synthase protein I